MAQSGFQMRLARLPNGVPYDRLHFSHFVDVPKEVALTDPVVGKVFGDQLDYGHLFAYLFRRFGYPNYGWDDYKDLARYILTTPRGDLLMEVIPYVGNHTCISFSFLVPSARMREIELYDSRPRRAWERRALDWQERQGLPDWMDDWMAACKHLATRMGSAQPADWRETVRWMHGGVALESELASLSGQFIIGLYNAYHAIEPMPNSMRVTEWSFWAMDDPLKPLAEAAHIALRGLLRPVRVRDNAINAMGPSKLRRVLREPAVAGYPSGALGNAAPQEFAKLQRLILELGKGNARRGISRLMHVAQRAQNTAEQPAAITPANEGPAP
jgi:hypothetical protein